MAFLLDGASCETDFKGGHNGRWQICNVLDSQSSRFRDGGLVMSSVSWAWESGVGRIVEDAEMADDSPDPSLLPRCFG